MPANTQPIFPKTIRNVWTTVTIGIPGLDGTGANYVLIVAGANGTRIDEIKCKSLGNCQKTVLRIFVNNGYAQSSALNNTFYAEIDLPQTVASSTSIVSTEVNVLDPIQNLVLPANHKLIACLGLSVADGWQVTVIGGDY